MVKVTGPTDINVRKLVSKLRKASKENEAPIWKVVYKTLLKSRRQRPVVNVGEINRYTKEGQTILVPGKVLGFGTLDHSVTVAALSFSKKAKEIIEKSGGRCLSISELIEENPKGSNVLIMK
ncbi:MAG: 50S ribosomal protein L18e [Candidatus Asgardarchaeia archaeon]